MKTNLCITLLFVLMPIAAQGEPRILEVDKGGSTPYKTLRSAAGVVQPGDTIKVKPGSGPYREELWIKNSGTAEAPIIFDGSGNTITGFEPLTGWVKENETYTCKLSVFPCVLTYRGERLVQDYTSNQFTKYADINMETNTLTLRPGTEPTGWEISRRAFAVRLSDASHHIYKNLKASGSTNDGFNLHGVGSGLVFENIEAFHNLDEGFSAHDSIQSTIRGGKFWGNDNGIANGYANKDDVSTTLENVDIWDNLGFGLVLGNCAATLKNVRCWNNGASQIRFNNAVINCENVIAYTPAFPTRIWASYKESKSSNPKSPTVPYLADRTTITGTPPAVEPAPAP